MADAGASSNDPPGASGPTGAAPEYPLDGELLKNFMAAFAAYAKSNRNEAQQEKDTPKKKKKVINKKLDALKRKSAEDKAKLSNTIKEMKKLHWLEIKENAMKRVEKRKSLIQKDEELIRTANEKLGLPTNE